MDNQEIHVARGNAAKELLKNEAFMAVSNELINSYVSVIVQSKPEDNNARETAYAGIRAVQDIIGVLNQWIAIRAQVIAAQEQDETQE